MVRSGRWEWVAMFLPAAPLLIAWAAFWPLGVSPANDDFLFYRNVQIWSQKGEWAFCTLEGHPTVTCLCHCGIGWIAAQVFGFSFRVAQTTSLLVCVLGVAATYALARRLGASRGVGWLFATTLATGPFFFGNAFNFMTDAPAVAWMALALAGYARGLRVRSSSSAESPSWKTTHPTAPNCDSTVFGGKLASVSIPWLLAGSVACLAGVWTRQTVFAIFIVPVIALLVRRPTWGSFLALAVAVGLPLAGLTAAAMGAFDTGLPDRRYPGLANWSNPARLMDAARTAWSGVLLFGLFGIPLTPVILGGLSRRGLVIATWLLAGLFVPYMVTGGRTCITNSTGYFLQNAHIGPILLADAFDAGRWGDMGDVVWPLWAWQSVSAAALAAAAVNFVALIERLIKCLKRDWLPPECGFFAGLTICLFAVATGFVVLFGTCFDRYWMTLLIPMFAGLATIAAGSNFSSGLRISWLLVAGQLLLSAILTHDYLAWNQARWRLCDSALSEYQLSPTQLDGGYEFNGWHRSGVDPETLPRPQDIAKASRFWSADARYHLAIKPRPGMTIRQQQSWTSWAVGGKVRTIYLLRDTETNSERIMSGRSNGL